MLGIPPLICFLLASLPIFYQAYNPTGFHACGIAEYPLGCIHPKYPYLCDRGEKARELSIFRFACIFLGNLTILVSVFILIQHVISRERRMNANPGDNANNLSNKATWQGIFYVAAFMFSWGPWYIWQVSESPATTFYCLTGAIPHVSLFLSRMVVDSHHIWYEDIKY